MKKSTKMTHFHSATWQRVKSLKDTLKGQIRHNNAVLKEVNCTTLLWPYFVTKFVLACAVLFFMNKTMAVNLEALSWKRDDSLRKDESNNVEKHLCQNSNYNLFNTRLGLILMIVSFRFSARCDTRSYSIFVRPKTISDSFAD
jgi:hypothetical protein